jgi:hypothetical protein
MRQFFNTLLYELFHIRRRIENFVNLISASVYQAQHVLSVQHIFTP